MSNQANYASLVKAFFAKISAANTNRDGTGTLVALGQAGLSGARIDKIQTQASSTTTAGTVRYFVTKGRPGVAISSITFSGTTAIVTTAVAHGLTTGNLGYVSNVLPDDYNVSAAAITVTGATTFTYVMATTPTANATSVGYYCTTPATAVTYLWREVAITAITPSGTVQAFANTMAATNSADQGYLPLNLPPGYILQAATHNAEAFNCTATAAGDF